MSTGQILCFMLGTAVLSSLMTLVVVGLYSHFKLGPMVEKRVEQRLQATASRLEERFRKRLGESLSGSSEVLRERARGLAKTGFDLLAARRERTDSGPESGEDQ